MGGFRKTNRSELFAEGSGFESRLFFLFFFFFFFFTFFTFWILKFIFLNKAIISIEVTWCSGISAVANHSTYA